MFMIEMARGSPVVSVRIPAELLDLVDEAIARSAGTRKEGVSYTPSGKCPSEAQARSASIRCGHGTHQASRGPVHLHPAFISNDQHSEPHQAIQ